MRQNPVAIIGAGKVGTVLSRKLFNEGFVFCAVISRHISSAKKLAQSINAPVFSNKIEKIPESVKLIIIAVPDSEVGIIASQLAKQNLEFKSLQVFHVSGCFSSEVLKPLKKVGALIYSIHPFQTFSSKSLDKDILKSIYYGIEGGPKALTEAKRIITVLGGNYLIIPKEKKYYYHTAGVFASNYLITLISAAEDILSTFVHDSKKRKKILEPILKESLKNILSKGSDKAITGPIVRGDVITIKKHIQSIKNNNPDLLSLYKAFGILTLKKFTGKIPDKKNAGKFKKLFNDIKVS